MDSKATFKVGIATSLMLLALILLLTWKAGMTLSYKGMEIIGEFENISGLSAGSDVRYRGYSIGKVKEILPSGNQILAKLVISNEFQIPEGSSLKIGFDGLIGEKFVSIIPTDNFTAYIKSGALLKGEASADIVEFVESGTQSLKEANVMIKRLKSVIASEEALSSMAETIHDMPQITNLLKKTIGDFDRVVIGLDLNKTIESFRLTSETFREIGIELKKDQSLSKMTKNFSKMSENLRIITDELRQFIEGNEEQSNKNPDTKKMQSDFSTLKKAIDKVRAISTTITNTSISAEADLSYRKLPDRGAYEADMNFNFNKVLFRLGVGDKFGRTDFSDIQAGYKFNKKVQGRIGLFYKQPGFGVDLQPHKRVRISTDIYNINDPNIDLTTKLGLTKHIDMVFRLDNIINSKADDYAVGLGLKY